MSEQYIDRYQVIDQLGRGGMATVYLAHDPRFGRDIALKLLPREFLHDATFQQRFEQEARIIAQLEHPSIVPVYDFGDFEDQPFLVMRHMPGGSLANRIRQDGAFTLEQSEPIIDSIASALNAAHLSGLIHRDVKPGNILFDQYENSYLSDFGIVRLTEATAQLTGSGIIGTPAYLAPEISEPDGLSSLLDVYALCVTLYEMLSGVLPYKAQTPMGLVVAHATKPVPNILDGRDDLPPALQHVIEAGMAKQPADRYQSAGALAEDFTRVISGEQPLGGGASSTAEPVIGTPVKEKPVAEKPHIEPADTSSPLPDMDVTRHVPSRELSNAKTWRLVGGGAAILAIVVLIILAVFGNLGRAASPEDVTEEPVQQEEETPATQNETDQEIPVSTSDPEEQAPTEAENSPAETLLPESTTDVAATETTVGDSFCGDRYCDGAGGESADTCSVDCTVEYSEECPGTYCGDGFCQTTCGEDADVCLADCGDQTASTEEPDTGGTSSVDAPTPTVGPPTTPGADPDVLFWADSDHVAEVDGGCTHLRWEVSEGAVYFEGQPVNNSDVLRVCIKETTTWSLDVFLDNGTRIHKELTVSYSLYGSCWSDEKILNFWKGTLSIHTTNWEGEYGYPPDGICICSIVNDNLLECQDTMGKPVVSIKL